MFWDIVQLPLTEQCQKLTGVDCDYQSIYHLLETSSEKNYLVKCEDVHKFPNLEITIGKKILTIEPNYYIITRAAGKCYCQIRTTESNYWKLGLVFFTKFYTKIDLTKNNGEVTFYVAKDK